MIRSIVRATIAIVALLFSTEARAAEVRAAVAANFAGPMRALGAEFTRQTGHQVIVTTGATGKLYAQIENGAPFDVLLAADGKTPATLEKRGLGVRGSRFTYAFGKLALYSAKPGYVDADAAVLKHARFEHLAIANPKLAPYGAAAIAVLTHLHLLESLRPKLVEGENIAQTLEFVVTGNAELGFVALSQIFVEGSYRAGSFWLVPESLYPPIRQDAVELREAANNPAARAFLGFLKTEPARSIIASYGYGLSPRAPAASGPSPAKANP
jgi:molybdate transport system substrate-binding protein